MRSIALRLGVVLTSAVLAFVGACKPNSSSALLSEGACSSEQAEVTRLEQALKAQTGDANKAAACRAANGTLKDNFCTCTDGSVITPSAGEACVNGTLTSMKWCDQKGGMPQADGRCQCFDSQGEYYVTQSESRKCGDGPGASSAEDPNKAAACRAANATLKDGFCTCTDGSVVTPSAGEACVNGTLSSMKWCDQKGGMPQGDGRCQCFDSQGEYYVTQSESRKCGDGPAPSSSGGSDRPKDGDRAYCSGNGVVVGGGSACQCDDGWYGDYCETSILGLRGASGFTGLPLRAGVVNVQSNAALGLTQDKAGLEAELEAAKAKLKACQQGATSRKSGQDICREIRGQWVDNMCKCGMSGNSQSESILQSDNGASCKRGVENAPFRYTAQDLRTACDAGNGIWNAGDQTCTCGSQANHVGWLDANGGPDALIAFCKEKQAAEGAKSSGREICERVQGQWTSTGACRCSYGSTKGESVLKSDNGASCAFEVQRVQEDCRKAAGTPRGLACTCGTQTIDDARGQTCRQGKFVNASQTPTTPSQPSNPTNPPGPRPNPAPTARCTCSFDSTRRMCGFWQNGRLLTPYFGPVSSGWTCGDNGSNDLCKRSPVAGVGTSAQCR